MLRCRDSPLQALTGPGTEFNLRNIEPAVMFWGMFASVPPGKEFIPSVDEVKREIEFTAPYQALIIYTPVASVRVRAAPAFFRRHGRPAGAPGIFTFVVG